MTQLFQQLNQAVSQTAALPNSQPNLLKAFLQSSNPKDFLQGMVKSQPKLEPLWQALSNSKLSPKEFFYQYARNNNIDPDQFIQSLQR